MIKFFGILFLIIQSQKKCMDNGYILYLYDTITNVQNVEIS